MTDKAVFPILCVAVVTNSTAFRRAVKRMDRQPKFLSKLLRHGRNQRRTGGNAEPQLRQYGDILHFTERLIENRHSRKDRCIRAGEIGKHSARQPIPAQHHRHATGDQRREQITESVRMRKWNDAKIEIEIADSHRFANLITISKELLAPELDGP